MREAVRSEVLPVQPAAVWQRLADYAGLSRWATAVTHSAALTEPADGPGAVRRVQVGRSALREEVTAWEAPRRLAYRVHGLPRVVRELSNTWTLDAAPDGTRVTVTSRLRTHPPLLAGLLTRRLDRVNTSLLRDLHDSCCSEVLR